MTKSITYPPDNGARCDEHIGEVFPPRCAECDAIEEDE